MKHLKWCMCSPKLKLLVVVTIQSINHGHGMGLTAFAFYKARFPSGWQTDHKYFFKRHEYPEFMVNNWQRSVPCYCYLSSTRGVYIPNLTLFNNWPRISSARLVQKIWVNPILFTIGCVPTSGIIGEDRTCIRDFSQERASPTTHSDLTSDPGVTFHLEPFLWPPGGKVPVATRRIYFFY